MAPPWRAPIPTRTVVLRGAFTYCGIEKLRGLDGIHGLALDSALALSAAAMVPLIDLPNLRRLSVDAKDDWMAAYRRDAATALSRRTRHHRGR